MLTWCVLTTISSFDPKFYFFDHRLFKKLLYDGFVLQFIKTKQFELNLADSDSSATTEQPPLKLNCLSFITYSQFCRQTCGAGGILNLQSVKTREKAARNQKSKIEIDWSLQNEYFKFQHTFLKHIIFSPAPLCFFFLDNFTVSVFLWLQMKWTLLNKKKSSYKFKLLGKWKDTNLFWSEDHRWIIAKKCKLRLYPSERFNF